MKEENYEINEENYEINEKNYYKNFQNYACCRGIKSFTLFYPPVQQLCLMLSIGFIRN